MDGRDLYDEVAGADPAMLAALSTPRSAYFGAASGQLGAVFRQTAEGRTTIRLRLDGLVRFSPEITPYVGRLHTLVHDLTVTVDLREGDGYILLNDRWLHGRTTFTGHRTMLRVIGDPLPHIDLPSGFQSTRARPAELRVAEPTTHVPRSQSLRFHHALPQRAATPGGRLATGGAP